jgi:hypothetical protein
MSHVANTLGHRGLEQLLDINTVRFIFTRPDRRDQTGQDTHLARCQNYIASGAPTSRMATGDVARAAGMTTIRLQAGRICGE